MFKFSLAPVLQHRELVEEQRQREHKEALDGVTRIKDAMQAISDRVDRSIEAIGRGMDGSMSLAERELHEHWLEAARGDLERLDRALELGEQETAKRREALAEAAKGRLILEQLHDQELESYRRALELKERKMFDEVALREYSMRRREENVSS